MATFDKLFSQQILSLFLEMFSFLKSYVTESIFTIKLECEYKTQKTDFLRFRIINKSYEQNFA